MEWTKSRKITHSFEKKKQTNKQNPTTTTKGTKKNKTKAKLEIKSVNWENFGEGGSSFFIQKGMLHKLDS